MVVSTSLHRNLHFQNEKLIVFEDKNKFVSFEDKNKFVVFDQDGKRLK
jgi:hypothetical protein